MARAELLIFLVLALGLCGAAAARAERSISELARTVQTMLPTAPAATDFLQSPPGSLTDDASESTFRGIAYRFSGLGGIISGSSAFKTIKQAEQ